MEGRFLGIRTPGCRHDKNFCRRGQLSPCQIGGHDPLQSKFNLLIGSFSNHK